jgi:CDP-diacylglycerol--glycerol-3-phosphate 3-phosphatidyltransferase
MAVMIIGREFAVSGLRGIAAAAGYTIKASDLGKTKMICQVVAISLVLMSVKHPELSRAANWMMWAVVVFTFASAVDYFRKFWRKIDIRVKKRRRKELLRMERRRKQSGIGQSGSRVGDFRGTI